MTTEKNSSDQDPGRPSLAPQSIHASPMVILDFQDYGLLLPAGELVSLASPRQLTTQPGQSSEACGSVNFDNRWYQIFCLDKALHLRRTLSAEQSALVLLRATDTVFGIACSSLTKLEHEQTNRFPVPPSMRSRKQPFSEFVLLNSRAYGNRAYGISSATTLLSLLQQRGVNLQPQFPAHQLKRGAS